MGPRTLFRYENVSARGCAGGGRSAPRVNLGPPHISTSETARARNLKFYTHLELGKMLFSGIEIFPLEGMRGRSSPA